MSKNDTSGSAADNPDTGNRMLETRNWLLGFVRRRKLLTGLIGLLVLITGTWFGDWQSNGWVKANTVTRLARFFGYYQATGSEFAQMAIDRGVDQLDCDLVAVEKNNATATDAKKELLTRLAQLKKQSKSDEAIYLLLVKDATPDLEKAYRDGQRANVQILHVAARWDGNVNGREAKLLTDIPGSMRAKLVNLEPETAEALARLKAGPFAPEPGKQLDAQLLALKK
jgi:hypothetical protein